MATNVTSKTENETLDIIEMSESIRKEMDYDLGNRVYSLIGKSFPGKYDRRIISDTKIQYKYLAFENGVVVAFCFWKIVEDEAILYVIGVDEARRRKGIGTAMMNRSFSDFRKDGACIVIKGHCWTGNPARNFHKTIGFTEECIEERYYKNGDDAIRIKMVL